MKPFLKKPFLKIERDELPRLLRLQPKALALFVQALSRAAHRPDDERTAGRMLRLGHGQFLSTDRELSAAAGMARATFDAARMELGQAALLAWRPAVAHASSATLYQVIDPEKWIKWAGRPSTELGTVPPFGGSDSRPPETVSGGPEIEPPAALGGPEIEPPAALGGPEIEPPDFGGPEIEPPDDGIAVPVAQNLAQILSHDILARVVQGSREEVEWSEVSARAPEQAGTREEPGASGLEEEQLLEVARGFILAWPYPEDRSREPLPLVRGLKDAEVDQQRLALEVALWVDAAVPAKVVAAARDMPRGRFFEPLTAWVELVQREVYASPYMRGETPAAPTPMALDIFCRGKGERRAHFIEELRQTGYQGRRGRLRRNGHPAEVRP